MSVATATRTSSADILASIPARVAGAVSGDVKAEARYLVRHPRRLHYQIGLLVGDGFMPMPVAVQIRRLSAELAKERAGARQAFGGIPLGDLNKIIALKQALVALRYARRFPGVV